MRSYKKVTRRYQICELISDCDGATDTGVVYRGMVKTGGFDIWKRGESLLPCCCGPGRRSGAAG